MRLPNALPRLAALALLLAPLGAVGLAPLGASPAEAATYRRVVGVAPGHVAWMRRAPDPASPKVGYLKSGALRVVTLGCRKLAKGGWCRVERRGTRGWVRDRYLATDAVMRG